MATEAPKPKRKRRWFRFSLRTFVVVLTVFCVWLGLLVYRVNKQREVVQWVNDNGGLVLYDCEWDNGWIDGAEPPRPEWLCDLIGIDYFADIVGVGFVGGEVKHIEPLGNLKQLQWLSLDRTNVSDLGPLRELTQLKKLFLGRSQVSDLGPLRGLSQLQQLNLNGTPVSDLSPLVKMKNVRIYLGRDQQVTVPEELKDRVTRFFR
ncbi:MAG: hypothetical protein IH991_25130 [Planctomycetes bacterium]|nr:hypothetical protein [Planctomycetota bacterium]